jgi:hypothetical protein
MLDLETLDTVPGAVILSIGAVAFSTDKPESTWAKFYTVIDRRSCWEAGLSTSTDTEAWWAKQSLEARKVIDEAESGKAPNLTNGLYLFNEFIEENSNPREVLIWGNGADFDNSILNYAYRKATTGQSHGKYANRCFRTLKGLARLPSDKFARSGVHHNAVDDAFFQAQQAVVFLKRTVQLIAK